MRNPYGWDLSISGEYAIGGLTKDDGTVSARRHYALIDRATGWLAGRLDCSMAEAAHHLATLARDTGTDVAEAAALLLGDGTPTAAPRQADGSPTLPDWRLQVPEQLVGKRRSPVETPPPAARPWTLSHAPWLPSGPEPPPSVVDLVPGPALLLTPVTGEDEEITDFVIKRLASVPDILLQESGVSLAAGKLLSQVFPAIRESGLHAALAQAFATGKPLGLDLFPLERIRHGRRVSWRVDIRCRRTGPWLLFTWHGHDSSEDLMRRLEEAAPPGKLGWAEWNLISGTDAWSGSLADMHGRPGASRPPSVGEYPRLAYPDDVAAVENAFRMVTEKRESAQVEYRALAAGEIRELRAAVSALYDPLGTPMIVRAVVRDVTASHSTEVELAAVRAKIERERWEATLRMQQAILPTPEHEFRYGRYDIAVRYQPAQSGSRVGGDWYEAHDGNDGAALVTIGDVAGHGLTAAAGMARIGNALRGLTVTRQSPDTLLTWLNDLVCADEIPERVASAAIGVLSQDPPRLHWAQAGHPPPVLVRDGEPRLLARPHGLLLGTMPGGQYELRTEDLAPGDRLVFYTDGLIERRDRDIDEGFDELLKTAMCCQDATAAAGAQEIADRLSPGSADDVCVLVVAVND